MELHQLRYVLAVAETGSFSRAAERLYVVQSNVSAQVRKLERELGVELFERRPHEVVPTAFGEAFLPGIRASLETLEDARSSLDALRGLTAGNAQLGVLGTVGNWLMPAVTSAFLDTYPGVELWITEEPSSILGGMVLSGDIPQALMILPQTLPQQLVAEPLFEEELVALVPAGHPLCGSGSAPLTAFAEEDVLLPEAGNQLRDMLNDACAEAGFHPRNRVEVGKKQLARELAVAGVAAAFMPALTALHDAAREPERVVRLTGPSVVRSVGLVRHQRTTLSPADAALAETIRATLPEHLRTALAAAIHPADGTRQPLARAHISADC